MILYTAFALVLIVAILAQIRRMQRRERDALAAAARGGLISEGPRAQHPRIDINHCIGCGACVDVCPEGDVLAVIGGKAAIANGHKCIGHGLCAEACPVGAIEIVMAQPSISADMPQLSPQFESNVPGLFIVGELGGLALIKNAVNQGRDCVDAIAARLTRMGGSRLSSGTRDVCIVGAGPAGISASLRAIERNLSYVTLEQDELGGTVAKYPRQKLVLTTPVELPLYGKFKKQQISKEDLLQVWGELSREVGLEVRTNERVDRVRKDADGAFTIETPKGRYRARTVILALGRRGTPRKLGVPGEELPHVMYSLIEAEAYTGRRILVVGGGDSAVEAAMGLAHQRGNQVTLSYRKEAFARLKDRNARHLEDFLKQRRLEVVLNSLPVEFRPGSAILQVGQVRRELPNDYTWIFIGGTPPSAFLEEAGVVLGPRDLTAEAAAALRVA
jgi:thioredoxin reductase/Pyruvate/2-oxoacid:ferredoxin oxidoreductase delta subunit